MRRALLAALAGLVSLPACDGSEPLPELDYPSAVAEDRDGDPDVVRVSLVARKETITLDDGWTLPLLTYEGRFPGPAIHARVGDRVIVDFTNELDEPTTIHWHGMRVPAAMDGSPRLQDPVKPGESFRYEFVTTEAATFWYHPHVRTNVQLEHGLYAPFVVRGPLDPDYDRERVLMLDDVLVDETGALVEAFATPGEDLLGRYGNRLLTNGRPSEKAASAAEEGDVERWRLVDTANARSMRLRVVGDASVRVIATDGGLLPEPYAVDELHLAVGQRFDLEVAYEGPGTVRLESAIPDGEGGFVWEPVYRVEVAATGREPRAIPWPAVPAPPERAPNRTETITLSYHVMEDGSYHWMLNGVSHPEEPLFTFALGDTVRLRLVNLTGIEHPFHLHGQFFTIVPNNTPWTMQPGLKDTVWVPPSQPVDVIAYLDNPGRWMAHCHILEHAERGMMAEIVVEE